MTSGAALGTVSSSRMVDAEPSATAGPAQVSKAARAHNRSARNCELSRHT